MNTLLSFNLICTNKVQFHSNTSFCCFSSVCCHDVKEPNQLNGTKVELIGQLSLILIKSPGAYQKTF